MVNINSQEAMKKFYSAVMLIAAAAIAFSSCNKVEPQGQDINDVNVEKSSVFHITASTIETKSVFGDKVDGAYPTKWTDNTTVAFSRDEANPVEGVPTLVNGGESATFEVELEGDNEEGIVYAFSPKGVHNSDPSKVVPGFTSINKTYHDIYLNIPSEQTPLANSVDEAAQALFGSAAYSNGECNLDMSFSHVVAYGKMAITNFAGGDITSIEITFPENVVGGSCYFYYTGDKEGTISNMNGKTITLNPDNIVDNVFWFALAPTAGDAGSMEIVITDDEEDTYTKTIDLTKKVLPFVKGQVSSFTANFSGIEADQPELPIIADGDYAIIAKDGDHYYAVSSDANGTTQRRDRVSVSYDGGESFETSNSKLVWTFTYSDGTYKIANDGNYMTKAQKTIPLDDNVNNAVDVLVNGNEDGTYTLTISDNAQYTTLAMNGTYGFGWYASTTGVNNLYVVPVSFVEPTYYFITVDATTNGTVTPSKTQAVEGETITLTVIPNEGYELATLTYNNIDIKDTKSFTMPASDVTVSATFVKNAGAQTTILDFATQAWGNSNYANSWTYGDWTVKNGANNNKGWAYVKMGGKNTTIGTANPCYIYNNVAIRHSVSKILVELPSGSLSKSGMSVNSWGVYVYSDEGMTNQIDYVEGGTITNAAGLFEFVPSTGIVWSKDYFYKVCWDLANTSTTNGVICVSKISLFEN